MQPHIGTSRPRLDSGIRAVLRTGGAVGWSRSSPAASHSPISDLICACAFARVDKAVRNLWKPRDNSPLANDNRPRSPGPCEYVDEIASIKTNPDQWLTTAFPVIPTIHRLYTTKDSKILKVIEQAKDKPEGVGKCPFCGVTVVRDLPGRCNDRNCPPLDPMPQKPEVKP